jgi:hypothetical protein
MDVHLAAALVVTGRLAVGDRGLLPSAVIRVSMYLVSRVNSPASAM